MRSILDELWYGNVCPNGGCRELIPEAKQFMKYIADHHDNLQATLTDEQKELLEKFDDCYAELTDINEREIFVYASRPKPWHRRRELATDTRCLRDGGGPRKFKYCFAYGECCTTVKNRENGSSLGFSLGLPPRLVYDMRNNALLTICKIGHIIIMRVTQDAFLECIHPGKPKGAWVFIFKTTLPLLNCFSHSTKNKKTTKTLDKFCSKS